MAAYLHRFREEVQSELEPVLDMQQVSHYPGRLGPSKDFLAFPAWRFESFNRATITTIVVSHMKNIVLSAVTIYFVFRRLQI